MFWNGHYIQDQQHNENWIHMVRWARRTIHSLESDIFVLHRNQACILVFFYSCPDQLSILVPSEATRAPEFRTDGSISGQSIHYLHVSNLAISIVGESDDLSDFASLEQDSSHLVSICFIFSLKLPCHLWKASSSLLSNDCSAFCIFAISWKSCMIWALWI